MDMPITVPRASVTESLDDLKARDMVLCRFPEVDMVVGKAGRAETPTDPAPMDMIETMVNFRPREFWPRRKLSDRRRRRSRAVPSATRWSHAASIQRSGNGGGTRDPDRAVGRGRLAALRRGQPRVCLPSQPGNAAQHRRDLADLDESRRSRGSAAGSALAAITSAEAGRRADRPGRADLHPARAWSSSSTARPSSTRPWRLSKRRMPRSARQAWRPRRGRISRRRRGPSPSRYGRQAGLEPACRAPADARRDPGTSSRAASAGGSCSGRSIATSWRRSAASSTRRSRCRAGPTSGRCRFRTGSTCWPPASTRRSASACSGATSTTSSAARRKSPGW